jgi:hypothetical protein
MKKRGIFSMTLMIVLGFLFLPLGWSEPMENQTVKQDLVLACSSSGHGGQPGMSMSNYEPTRVVFQEVVRDKSEERGTTTNGDDQSLLVSTTKLVGNIVLFPFKLVSTALGLIF